MNASVAVRANEEMVKVEIPTRAQAEAAERKKQSQEGQRRDGKSQSAMRERFEKMTPEEREKFMQRMKERGMGRGRTPQRPDAAGQTAPTAP